MFNKNCVCNWRKMGKRISNANYLLVKIILHCDGGKEGIPINSIMRIEGICNYTVFYLKNGRKITMPYSLKYYMKLLPAGHFGRYSKFHIINLGFVRDFNKSKIWVAIQNKMSFTDVNNNCRMRFEVDFKKHGNKQVMI